MSGAASALDAGTATGRAPARLRIVLYLYEDMYPELFEHVRAAPDGQRCERIRGLMHLGLLLERGRIGPPGGASGTPDGESRGPGDTSVAPMAIARAPSSSSAMGADFGPLF